MDTTEQTAQRVLRWRISGLPTRTAQAVLIAVLCWFANRQPIVAPWLAVAIATGLVDARLSRALYQNPGDRRLGVLTGVGRVVSATAFALVMIIFGLSPQRGSVACALLVGCATILNNALMSRGSRTFAVTLVGPSALVMMATPVAAYLSGQALSANTTGLLVIGVVGYVVFIARLAETLYGEDRALRDALEAAQTANRAKSDFLATVSHEIRTPLNGVLGMAQALRRDELSPSQHRRLDIITESGEILLAILNDMLDLSKIEAGTLQLEIADFDVEEMARGARAAFTPLANRKGLSFDLIVEAPARGVYTGDSARVRQILYNLISNGIKFTDTGEVRGAISATPTGLRIEVSDTGIGIAPERIDSLFEKFVQADSSSTRRFGGVGIGLAICKALCSSMGGEISVTSALAAGSRFVVDLPLAPGAGTAVRTPDQAEPPVGADASFRVLAAEDNRVNQLVLRTLLGQIGLDPTIVDNGAEALAAWEQGHYDLILMDVQMPVMDGAAATEAIRTREAASGRPATPIVALTANAMRHQVEAYRAAGMNGILAKPLEIAALFKTIQSVADGEPLSNPLAA
jgi:signal transduction histidine kinase/ActR/RegA family two-component response regulator